MLLCLWLILAIGVYILFPLITACSVLHDLRETPEPANDGVGFSMQKERASVLLYDLAAQPGAQTWFPVGKEKTSLIFSAVVAGAN